MASVISFMAKSHFLLVGSGTTVIFYPIKYKIFIKAFQYILKSLQDFSV